jgi:hypothetical protein
MSGLLHVYVSQAKNGGLVMGAARDNYVSYAQRGSFHILEWQFQAALELYPIMSRAHLLRTWAGIVDVSPDASPIIGTTPVDNLFVNCGWGTGGFKATPVSGWVYAHTVAHGKPHELNAAFNLERFKTGALIEEHGAAAVAHCCCSSPVPTAAPERRPSSATAARACPSRPTPTTGPGRACFTTARPPRGSSRSAGSTPTGAGSGSTFSETP